MEHKFVKFLFFCALTECIIQFGQAKATTRIKRAYRYLSPFDPKYHEKLEIERQNLIRIDEALADLRRNSHKYSFRQAAAISTQIHRVDLTKVDALDGISYFTKNSLYRYRVNKQAVKSVKNKIKYLHVKFVNIYDSSVDAFIKTRRKFVNIISNSWRRSYILNNEKYRKPITFN